MDIKAAVNASRRCIPVLYNGTKYRRITARITRVDEMGGESYSLELADYCGSSVMIAPVEEVETSERNNNAKFES